MSVLVLLGVGVVGDVVGADRVGGAGGVVGGGGGVGDAGVGHGVKGVLAMVMLRCWCWWWFGVDGACDVGVVVVVGGGWQSLLLLILPYTIYAYIQV